MKNEENRHRWKSAHWDDGEQDVHKSVYEALLQLFTEDRVGMLADIAVALSDMKVSILQVNSQKRTNGRGIISLKISCKNIEHYSSIVARLRGLSGVIDVVRGFST
jgi:GTP pyrophosphokinase